LHIHEKNADKYHMRNEKQTKGNLFVNKQGETTEK
jgi:hypothetical protein